MKKFLTVLLALSVVFTYTVGTAFAAVVPDNTTTTTHTEAMVQAEKEVVDAFNKNITTAKNTLADEYKEEDIHQYCVISGSVYAATLDQISKDFADLIRIAAQKVDLANPDENNVAALITKIKEQTAISLNLAYAGSREIKVDVAELADKTAAELVSYVTADANTETKTDLQAYYMILTWSDALSAMKNDLNGELAKIDMNLYTNDVADKDDPYQKTWAQLATEEKDRLSKAVADTNISVGLGQTAAKNALAAMYTTVFSGITAYKTVDTITGTIVVSYKLSDSKIKTVEDLKVDDSNAAATKADLKAKIQSYAAAAQKQALAAYNAADKSTAAKKEAAEIALETAQENIEAYVAVNTLLIDEDVITTETQFKQNGRPAEGACLTRVKLYKEAAALAATLKVQVEKDGTLKYIASKIDENLAKAQIKIYNTGVAATEADLIAGAKNESDNLDWLKEVALANVDVKLDSVLYDADNAEVYYAPEKAKVEAKYQEWKDKINAATTVAQLDAVKNSEPSLTGIDSKTVVNNKLNGYVNTTKFIEAVNNYVNALNIGIAPYADGRRNEITSADDIKAVVEFLAEKDARTNADVANLLGQAEAYAKALPTNGEKKAAKAAVDALVNAIPNVVTLADKPAVKAAWEAAEKAGYTPAKLTRAIALVKSAEADAIDDMLAALPKTLTAANKDAIDAIMDAVDAYENEEMYGYDDYAKADAAEEAFKAVRTATLIDVQNTIAALPDNPTKEQVETARAAVDAFVNEYTDAYSDYQAIAKIENLDKLTFAEAQVKANIIAATKALQIKTSTKLYKGSKIRVNWKVVDGDASNITGYQVYKSKKAQSGYTYMGKTTKTYMDNKKNLKKGTRYYYKVRAYVEIDGVKYYSDWSNKGNRIYK